MSVPAVGVGESVWLSTEEAQLQVTSLINMPVTMRSLSAICSEAVTISKNRTCGKRDKKHGEVKLRTWKLGILFDV